MAQIGTYRLETAGGTVDVPVFDTGDSGANVEEYLRVNTASGVGFVPLASPSDATHEYLRIQTANDGVLAVHDAAAVSTQLQYFATNVSGGDTTWPDDQGNADMTLTGNESDATLSDGSDALSFDGSSDHGTTTMPSTLEGSSLNAFSVEFTVQYPGNSGRIIGAANSTGNQRFAIAMDADEAFTAEAGNFNVRFVDDTGSQMQFSMETNPNLDDGNRHDVSIIIDDASNSNATIIIDGAEQTLSFDISGNPSSFVAWDVDMATAALNAGGTVGNNFDGSIGAIRWHDTNISSQTISEY